MISASSEQHIPVLLNEVLESLTPADNETYVDGTFGLGGYSKAILESSNCVLYGIDRDPEAKVRAEIFNDRYGTRFHFLHGRFGEMASLLTTEGITQVDGIVLDIGVSSPQLDNPERGFSFKTDGPLDMRMGSSDLTAADVVNSFEEKDIADIIYKFGEEKNSRKIARVIVERRKETAFKTTQELAELIRNVVPFERKGFDPATRTFQALRIYVNDELGELERALNASEQLLKPGGRLIVVTFHSLEDRLVKHFIKEKTGKLNTSSRHMPAPQQNSITFKNLTKKAVEASKDEIRLNPRARSAKLRAAIRLGGSNNA